MTRAEIEDIRGVTASKGSRRRAVGDRLDTSARAAQIAGRPVTYGTTETFLSHFGLDALERSARAGGTEGLGAAGRTAAAGILRAHAVR